MSMFGLIPDAAEPMAPSPAMHTPQARFAESCLQWARDRGEVHTRVLPGNVLPAEGPDRILFDGYTAAPTVAPTLGYFGLLSFVGAWLLSAFSERLGPKDALGGTLGWAAIGVAVLGGVALLAAWLVDRHARRPVLAVVDAGEDNVTEEELRGLQTTSGGRRLWVFSRQGFDGAAAAFALVAGIRCLVPSGAAFLDADVRASTTPVAASRTPRSRQR